MATIIDYLHSRATVLRTSGPNVFIECPSCGTRKQKCSIHINKAIGNCFRASCSLNGGFSFPTLIAYIEKVDYSQALAIAGGYEDEVEVKYQAKAYGTNRDYPKNSLPLQELLNLAEKSGNNLYFSLVEHAVTNLVQKRKLTEEQMREYAIGVGYEDYTEGENKIPRYAMIIIPTFFNDRIVSYGARSIEIKGACIGSLTHYNPVEAENYLLAGQMLFNCDKAIPQACKEGVLGIVEDRWSAIKLGNAVATCGSYLSDEQLFILANNYKGPVVIVRDNDLGGREACFKDAQRLSKYYDDIRIVTPKGVDPDDFLEDTKQQILNSKPIDLFQLKLSKLVFK